MEKGWAIFQPVEVWKKMLIY